MLLRAIKSKVKGDAANAISSFEFTGWDSLKQALLATYADKRDLETLTIELCNLKQGKLKVLEFYNKIQENLNLKISCIKNHYNNDSTALIAESQRLALRVFIKHLNNPLSEYLSTRKPATLNDALHILVNDYNINDKFNFVEPRSSPQPSNKSFYSQTFRNPNSIQNPQLHNLPWQTQRPNTVLNRQPPFQNANKSTPMSGVTSHVGPGQNNFNRTSGFPRKEELNLINGDNPQEADPQVEEYEERAYEIPPISTDISFDNSFLFQRASEITHPTNS